MRASYRSIVGARSAKLARMDTATIEANDRHRAAARLLHDLAKPLRVLSALGWEGRLREEFLASGGEKLPAPTYERFDATKVVDGVAQVRRLLRSGALADDWLEREARAVQATALMLAAAGTPAFHEYSRELYGVPKRPLRFDPTTPLDLAEQVHQAIGELSQTKLLVPPARDRTGEQVAAELELGVRLHFGAAAPRVQLVEELSANAVATSTCIKVRRDAMFTRRDAAQLLNHEAFIHVATALNGQAQTDLPNLAIGHPGTTRTQEGLAVFSEFVSGTLELDRLRRLADRVVAVQMVCDGADFIELYRWFLERSASREQAFESTRRIFRGAPLTGGAPFTKDCGYLSGLLGVMMFVRAAFAANRSDTLGLLFAGKLDLTAIPALADLRSRGLCRRPRFLPPWASDPGWVLSYLTLSTFLTRIDLTAVVDGVKQALEQCPPPDPESDEPRWPAPPPPLPHPAPIQSKPAVMA
jgi:uncharacterized protein (TIGR02421 family)